MTAEGGFGYLTLYGDAGDSFTFTAPTGKKFTKIEITNNDRYLNLGDDNWSAQDNQIVWSGTPSNTVTLAGNDFTAIHFITSIVFTLEEPASTTGYKVALAEDTEDAANWTIAPAAATTTGVAAGTSVKAKYSGTKKVKSVKAVKTAMAPAEGKTYTNLQGGEVLNVGDKFTETAGKFRSTHNENPKSTDYYALMYSSTTYEVIRADVAVDGYSYKYTESPNGQYYVLKSTYYNSDYEEWVTQYDFNQNIPVTKTSDGITVTLDGQDGNQRNLYTFWVHEP